MLLSPFAHKLALGTKGKECKKWCPVFDWMTHTHTQRAKTTVVKLWATILCEKTNLQKLLARTNHYHVSNIWANKNGRSSQQGLSHEHINEKIECIQRSRIECPMSMSFTQNPILIWSHLSYFHFEPEKSRFYNYWCGWQRSFFCTYIFFLFFFVCSISLFFPCSYFTQPNVAQYLRLFSSYLCGDVSFFWSLSLSHSPSVYIGHYFLKGSRDSPGYDVVSFCGYFAIRLFCYFVAFSKSI